MATELRLAALALPGLSPDSLGNYLSSLGLLRVLSRKWPSTRIAWRDEVLQVIGGPATLDELLDELVRVASERVWTPYVRDWTDAQKKSSELAQKPKAKAISGVPLALWQAEASEDLLEGFTAHVVAHVTGRSMNPILGKAGKIGQRDFANGWARAVDLLGRPKPLKERKNETPAKKAAREKADAENVTSEAARKRAEIKALLQGTAISWLEKNLNAATWFSHANKLYNNGQRPFRDGLLSPWLMVLACEGISFLSGGSSRRLGAKARAVGAFPFVTQAAASDTSGQAKRDTAELWAPVWERPMAVSEVATLFRRGRAELGARSVQTPAAFASAILQRGVDAGVAEFRRFVLGWTTAQDYVEPRFQGAVANPSSNLPTSAALSKALGRITALIEHRGFPRDGKRFAGLRGGCVLGDPDGPAEPRDGKRFAGLRGPIESALLDVAAEPSRSEAAIALLDAVAAALDRIDRNRSFREGKIRWEPLPLEWLPSLFADEQPAVEARLALSLVSGFPEALPFAAFRFGVQWAREKNGKYEYDWATKPAWFEHSKVASARWVWRPGELARVLGAVLSRKLLEEAKLDGANTPRPPGRAPLPATASQVCLWLAGDIDESLFSAWLSRLALFDWRRVPQQARALVQGEVQAPRVDGELALLGLLQPLVDQRSLVVRTLSPNDLLSDETGVRTTQAARSLVTLIRSGNIDAARRLANSRYAMAGARVASFDAPWCASEPDRLVGALLFTISDRDRAVLFQRWLRPRRRQPGGEAHD
jgi:CRISPR-associated protein Csx17